VLAGHWVVNRAEPRAAETKEAKTAEQKTPFPSTSGAGSQEFQRSGKGCQAF